MKHYHFYDQETGLIHADALVVNAASGHEQMAAANCPAGHKPIEGHLDALSQRVDVATGKPVDYQPSQPSADHEWNADVKRWQLLPDVAQRQEARRAALAQIHALEATQPRAVRELLLELAAKAGHTSAGAERLAGIDAELAGLREKLGHAALGTSPSNAT